MGEYLPEVKGTGVIKEDLRRNKGVGTRRVEPGQSSHAAGDFPLRSSSALLLT